MSPRAASKPARTRIELAAIGLIGDAADFHVRVQLRLHEVGRAILRAVVHHDHLGVASHAGDAAHAFLDVARLIVARYHDRHGIVAVGRSRRPGDHELGQAKSPDQRSVRRKDVDQRRDQGNLLRNEHPARHLDGLETVEAQEICRVLAGYEVTAGIGSAQAAALADPQELGPHRVDRADQHATPRLQQPPTVAEQAVDVVDILQDVVDQDAIEPRGGIEEGGVRLDELEVRVFAACLLDHPARKINAHAVPWLDAGQKVARRAAKLEDR